MAKTGASAAAAAEGRVLSDLSRSRVPGVKGYHSHNSTRNNTREEYENLTNFCSPHGAYDDRPNHAAPPLFPMLVDEPVRPKRSSRKIPRRPAFVVAAAKKPLEPTHTSLYPAIGEISPPRTEAPFSSSRGVQATESNGKTMQKVAGTANVQHGLDVHPNVKLSNHPACRIDAVPIASLRQCYWEDWQSYKSRNMVMLTHLDTYQGRLPQSVNGCTVIAPLLAIHHLHGEGPGIADSTIDEVIDQQASTMLSDVRTSLGLPRNSLIIPSDVQEYIIDQGLLAQDQFVTVCGGNIMDAVHLNELVKVLACCGNEYEGHRRKKIAAVLFFHGHVICILKMFFPDGRSWFDVIDSLPCTMTLTGTQDESGWNKSAVRIRCKSVQSLVATLNWYSCSKFTNEDCSYVDMFRWEDSNADSDPRVFQAFTWTESKASTAVMGSGLDGVPVASSLAAC